MDPNRNDLLGELASDAALERSDFLVNAAEQMQRFLERNRKRIDAFDGLVLIDDEPDYLAVAPDLSFRSRSRYLDEESGQWVNETEVIESAAELVELYNPADVYQWFSEAAREAAGLAPEPTGADDVLAVANVAGEDTPALDEDRAYAEAADTWAAAHPRGVDTDEEIAGSLYDLAVDYLDRSQKTEASLIARFEEAAGPLSARIGDLIIIDDDDERLVLNSAGRFTGEVVPEGAEGEWKKLTSADDIVAFYDPTDVFSDLADALAEGYPGIDQPQEPAEEGEEGQGEEEQGG
jgi:hypothetical protein